MKKTIAELIDELTVTNIKVFHLVDKVTSGRYSLDDAKKIQDLNMYRSELKNAINEELGGRKEIKV